MILYAPSWPHMEPTVQPASQPVNQPAGQQGQPGTLIPTGQPGNDAFDQAGPTGQPGTLIPTGQPCSWANWAIGANRAIMATGQH